MTDTDLFLEVLNEAIDNYNLQTNSTQARIDNPAPGKAQTNWLDLVLRTAVTYTTTASVSGGTDKTNYYLSANYKHNEGVIINNQLKRYNLKVNLDTEIKKWLKVGTALNLSYSRNNRVPTGYNIGTSVITRAIEQRPWDSLIVPTENMLSEDRSWPTITRYRLLTKKMYISIITVPSVHSICCLT